MSQLRRLGVAGKGTGQAAAVFDEIVPNIHDFNADKPSILVENFWSNYKNRKNENKDLNGKIFEYLLAVILAKSGIFPLYLSAKVAFVPNVSFDIMFYTKEMGPICISAKTSLRERYKQADLEAIALKYVHRKAKSYLVTLDTVAAVTVKNKILTGDVIGIENVIVANSHEFDELIVELTKLNFTTPPIVEVISSNFVVTKERFFNL